MDAEKIAKAKNLIAGLAAKPDFIETTIAALDAAGFSVLKNLRTSPLPPGRDPEREAAAKTGIFIDTETTGLTDQDKVIQLAGIRFRYDDHGIVSIANAPAIHFKDPGFPIPPEITRLTGITDEMVADKTITEKDIAEMTDGVSIVLAHHASFDRPFVERDLPGSRFQELPWACSLNHIDWDARGEKGRSLELLMLRRGYTFQAHDAGGDVLAGAVLLSFQDPQNPDKDLFQEMMANGMKDRLLIVAVNSPFAAKDKLKEAGYIWNAEGKDTMEKAWQKEVDADEASLNAERQFLQGIYSTSKLKLPAFRISPLNRFSARLGPNCRETIELTLPSPSAVVEPSLFGTPMPQSESVLAPSL